MIIEDAIDLQGFVVYAGEELPFLWTQLHVYPTKNAASKAVSKNPELQIVPVESVFYLESYLPFGHKKFVTRVASRPDIPREERPRK